jgi:hypothetical protein
LVLASCEVAQKGAGGLDRKLVGEGEEVLVAGHEDVPLWERRAVTRTFGRERPALSAGVA